MFYTFYPIDARLHKLDSFGETEKNMSTLAFNVHKLSVHWMGLPKKKNRTLGLGSIQDFLIAVGQ